MTATAEEVDRCLAGASFERCAEDGARWNYPTGDAILYLGRGPYDPNEVPESMPKSFDDFVSTAHGWTLDEIRGGAVVQGLRFFDYLGAYRK
jgi:hypothetical protein